MIKASKLHIATFTSYSLLKHHILHAKFLFSMSLSFYWGPLYGVGEKGWSLWGWKVEAHGSSWVLGFPKGLVVSTLFPYLFIFSLFGISILARNRKTQPLHGQLQHDLSISWAALDSYSPGITWQPSVILHFPLRSLSAWVKFHFRWSKNVLTVIHMFVTAYRYL